MLALLTSLALSNVSLFGIKNVPAKTIGACLSFFLVVDGKANA